MKKESFSLFSFIKIRFADPISTIGLSKKNVAIGTGVFIIINRKKNIKSNG